MSLIGCEIVERSHSSQGRIVLLFATLVAASAHQSLGIVLAPDLFKNSSPSQTLKSRLNHGTSAGVSRYETLAKERCSMIDKAQIGSSSRWLEARSRAA